MDDPGLITHEQLYSLVQHAGLPIIMTDAAGVITGINHAAAQFYGYEPEALSGQSLLMLMPGYNRPEHERAIWQVTHSGESVSLVTEHLSRSGAVLLVRAVFSPIMAADQVVGVCVISIDIQERVVIQSALQQERDRLEAILETTNDAIIMLDPDGRIVSANLQFETFFRLPRYHIIDQPVEVLAETIRTRPDLPAELINVLLAFGGDIHQSAGGDFEVAPPERRVLVWYSSPVHAHDGSTIGRLFVFRDATHEREIDRMKTEFVSLVSHELRTPLTAVRGFADFILEGDAGEIGPELRSYVEIIRVNAERLTSLINDILDLTKIESGRIDLRAASHRLDEIVDAVLLSIKPMIDSHQQSLGIDVPQHLPSIWADRDRLTQILMNLLTNASKYTACGGKLDLRATLVVEGDPLPPGAPAVKLPAFLISVHDNGMGIAPPDQINVFTRFYRTEQATRNQIQGSGLGLTIVKSFVELHGGKIWLISELGQGTSVYFTIPFVEGV